MRSPGKFPCARRVNFHAARRANLQRAAGRSGFRQHPICSHARFCAPRSRQSAKIQDPSGAWRFAWNEWHVNYEWSVPQEVLNNRYAHATSSSTHPSPPSSSPRPPPSPGSRPTPLAVLASKRELCPAMSAPTDCRATAPRHTSFLTRSIPCGTTRMMALVRPSKTRLALHVRYSAYPAPSSPAPPRACRRR
jgi:hypothetical protein